METPEEYLDRITNDGVINELAMFTTSEVCMAIELVREQSKEQLKEIRDKIENIKFPHFNTIDEVLNIINQYIKP